MRILFVLLVLANLALFAAGQGFFGPPPAERGRDPGRLLMELHPETIHVPNDLDRQADPVAPEPVAPASSSPAPVVEPDAANAAAAPSEAPAEPAETENQTDVRATAAAASDAVKPDTAPAEPPAADPAVQTAPPAPLPAPAPVPAPTIAPEPTPAAPRPAKVETVCREWGSFTETEVKRARQWAHKNAPGLTVRQISEAGPTSWMVMVPPAANLAAAQKTAVALGKQGIKDLFVIQDAGPNQYAISLGVFSQEKSARSLAQSLQGKAGRSLSVVPRSGPSHHWLQFPTLPSSQQATLRTQALNAFSREWRTCKP